MSDLASFFFNQIRQGEQERDRVFEPVIGIVTDNKDPEKLLRVKVKIPSLSSEETTWWVPIVSLGAGKERGWFFLPEVNDEVLLAFEHGDINHPVVLGALWNGKDAPPENNSSGSNPKRVLVSRGGSRVEFDDEKNEIAISDGGGKGVITFKADDNKLTIEAKEGDVLLLAPQGKLQIKVTGAITFDAQMNLDVRGKQTTNISAGSNVTIKASGMLSITGGTTDINKGGTPEAKAASTSPGETPDDQGAGGGGGDGGTSPGATSQAGGPSAASASAASDGPPERVLKRLTREANDDEEPRSRGVGPPSGLFMSPDDAPDPTKDPLITAVKWQDAETAWGTPRVLTAPRKKGLPKPKVKVTAIARNVGSSVTVTIVDADTGATVASGSARVVNEAVTYDFVPADAGVKKCADVRAIVEGGGEKGETVDVLHVHQPYWDDATSNGLAYGVKWPKGERFPNPKNPKRPQSMHAWETIESIVVDNDEGQKNLDAWKPRLTLYMAKHLGVDAASPVINNPRCGFYVRDLQADLASVKSFFDTEGTLTGGGFSTTDAPSGIFGPLTFLGLFLLQRLAMYPKADDNPGATRDGQPADLAKDEQLALKPTKDKHRPREVDAEISKLLQAWVVGKLTVRVEGEDFEQVEFKNHGAVNKLGDALEKASTKHVQRRIARRYQMWILGVELLGAVFPNAGERREWDWPLWRKYANGRSATTNHFPGLAMDFSTNDGSVVPYSIFVVVRDPDPKRKNRFQLWENLAVARKLKASLKGKDYPKQPADHLTADDRRLVSKAVAAAAPSDTLTASLHKSGFSSAMKKHAETAEDAIKTQAKDAKTAKDSFDKAFKVIFKGLTKDEQLAKLQALHAGSGTQAELTTYEGQKKNLQTFLIASTRIAVLAIEHRRFVVLKEFASADDAKRTKFIEELRESIDDLKQRSQGAVHETAPPFQYKPGRTTRSVQGSLTIALSDPQKLERAVLGAELAARRKVLAALESANVDGDVIVFPIKGEFVRLDQLAEETCKVYRIERKGEWEWWHYQYFDPEETDQHLKADALIVEMARELGTSKVVQMFHLTEVEPVTGQQQDDEEELRRGVDQPWADKKVNVPHGDNSGEEEELRRGVDQPWADKKVNVTAHGEGDDDVDSAPRKKPTTTRAAMYEWWRERHPTEFDGEVHATGVTLAEFTKSTA